MLARSIYWQLVSCNRNFRRLWVAQIVSEIGDWFYSLAIYSLLLELTGSAALVGLAVVLQVLPQTFIAPTAGVVNDRLRRKRVMIAADIARMAIVLGMLLVRTRATVWLVWPLLFLETLGAAFFEPARSSVLPNIASDRELLAANTLASMTWSFDLAVGATLGGVAATLLGRDGVFIANALSFLASALLIAGMKFDEPHTAGAPPFHARELVDFSPIVEGVRYIGGDRQLLATVLVKCGIGFVGANNVILPVMGQRLFPVRVNPMLGMSLLVVARGVGALIGPLLAGQWAGDQRQRLRTGILIGFLVASAGYMCVAAAPNIGIAIACVVLGSSGSAVNWVFSTTLLQAATEDRFRGRVFAADMGLLTLTIALSSYVAGQCNDWGVPIRVLAFASGAVALIPATLWALTLRLNSPR